jgi:hypothetical protein
MWRATAASGMLLAVALAAGCELEEVAAPPSADVLVIESILRAGAASQFVLLHRSMEGRVIRGEPGAEVTVKDVALARAVTYQEVPLRDCLLSDAADWNVEDLAVEASCYVADRAGRFVEPGRTYELMVRTRDGRLARGRTTVPAAFDFREPDVRVNRTTFSIGCRLPARPFTLTWTRAEGAWAYVATLQLENWGEALRERGIEVPEPLELTGVSVSAADTTMRFPEHLGLFSRGSLDQRIFFALRQGLPPETEATLVVLAADRNYTNAIRGGRFNPSGDVRASSVVGDGVGLFGSVVPLVVHSRRFQDGSEPPPCE